MAHTDAFDLILKSRFSRIPNLTRDTTHSGEQPPNILQTYKEKPDCQNFLKYFNRNRPLYLLTDEVLVLKVLPSGMRAGSLLRAEIDNTISSYANVLTKTVNDLGLGPNRILTKLN